MTDVMLWHRRRARGAAFAAAARVALAALLALAAGCGDAVQPNESSVERLAPPLLPPPPPPPPPEPRGAGPEYIYVANADGSEPKRLVRGGAPAWSPDGRRIAFHVRERYLNAEIHVVNADGTGDVKLAEEGTVPAWSPNGTAMAFASSKGISVMNADGSGAKVLIGHGFREDTYKPWDMGVTKPAWSPDGALIAFEHQGDGDIQPAQIYVMNADGSKPRLLTESMHPGTRYAESDPSWSPDGSKILFWSYGYGIMWTDRNGGTASTLFSAFPDVSYNTKPAWSPNGSSIAFNRWSPGGRDVWTMQATGAGARMFIQDAHDAVWSPDGARIAFASTRLP